MTPRTEAGWRLLTRPMLSCDTSHVAITDTDIAAIEAEAIAQERARLREAVEGLDGGEPYTWVDRAAVLALINEP